MAIDFPSDYKFAGEKAGSKSSTDDPRLWYPSQLKEGEKIYCDKAIVLISQFNFYDNY